MSDAFVLLIPLIILAIVSPVVVVGCGLQDEGATTLHSFTLSRDADKFSLTVQ